jgi:hypothetical protein
MILEDETRIARPILQDREKPVPGRAKCAALIMIPERNARIVRADY